MVNTKDVPKKITEGMRFSSKCDGMFFYFGSTDTFGLLWELSREGETLDCSFKHIYRVYTLDHGIPPQSI